MARYALRVEHHERLHDGVALLTKISFGLGLEGLSTDFTLEQEPLIFNV
jgi:hypothetical protein